MSNKVQRQIRRGRSRMYRAGALLGDLEALASLDPKKIVRRVINKSVIGKRVRGLYMNGLMDSK